MKCIQGKALSGGIAIGKMVIYKKAKLNEVCVNVSDIDAERERYRNALAEAGKQIKELYNRTITYAGEEEAEIFGAYLVMLDDPEYGEAIERIIVNEGINAECAIKKVADKLCATFEAMDDEYFKERSMDVRDVSDRIINILSGTSSCDVSFNEPVIVYADELTPGETMNMDKEKVLAFVTKKGGVNSHTAILARSMGIPAISGVEFEDISLCIDDKTNIEVCDNIVDMNNMANKNVVIIDGNNGRLIAEPTKEVLDGYVKRQKVKSLDDECGDTRLSVDNIGADIFEMKLSASSIKMFANISSVNEAKNALENGAEGVGLFRTEFLYLGREDYPSEEEQFQVYKEVAEIFGDKPVIIRTLDIGADKKEEYLCLDDEENPALGYRGIRVCLDRKDMFKTQLRAILKAALYGNVWIMFPMIISVDEVLEAKRLLEEARAELREGRSCVGNIKNAKVGNEKEENINKLKVGVMIETPAAVMISDELAKEVDFFSIGTNDLSQYTLAIDRQNEKLDNVFDTHHKAILKMIEIVAENAHKAGIEVGICGELAADETLMDEFVRMGIDELSVAVSVLGRRG